MKIVKAKRKARIFYWALAAVMAAALVTAGCKTETNSGDEQTTETGKHDDKKKDDKGKGGDKDSQKGNGKGAGGNGDSKGNGKDSGSGGAGKEGGKDSGKGDTPPTPQQPEDNGKYKKVPYSDLDAYLKDTASATETNYIEVTGLTKDALLAPATDPCELGKKIKAYGDKKVSLKLGLPIEGLENMKSSFRTLTNLVELDAIPDGVKDIEHCFEECTGLTTAPKLPSSVEKMERCFFKCTSLTEAPAIPSKVESIDAVFTDCTSLTKAPTIPANVKTMRSTFSHCSNLSEAPVIPAQVEALERCFSNCPKLTSIHLKCEYSYNQFDHAFKQDDGLGTGSIKVPSASLQTYKDEAKEMDTTADKFAAEN
ncbi:MAG: leucine-rich repeat domain-containing protein [Treponema sp.]